MVEGGNLYEDDRGRERVLFELEMGMERSDRFNAIKIMGYIRQENSRQF